MVSRISHASAVSSHRRLRKRVSRQSGNLVVHIFGMLDWLSATRPLKRLTIVDSIQTVAEIIAILTWRARPLRTSRSVQRRCGRIVRNC